MIRHASLIAYWLGLAVWLAALATAAIAAANTFAVLPGTALVLERFAAYPADEHGRLAAGLVMADVFFSADLVQVAGAALAVGGLVVQLAVCRLPWRGAADLTRIACVGVAATLLAVYALGLAPALNARLREYWAAAEAGEVATARAAQTLFTRGHRSAELILSANLLLVSAAIAASAVALGPTPGGAPTRPAPAGRE